MPRTDPPVAPPFVQGQRGETGWADWIHAQVEAQWAEKVAITDLADPASAARIAGDGVWAPAALIDMRGAVSGVRAYRVANQTGIATATYTAMSWTGVDDDPDGWWSSGAPTRLTCPPAGEGRVSIAAAVMHDSSSTGTRRTLRVWKNGTKELVRESTPLPSTSVSMSTSVSVRDTAAAGDYYEVQVWQDSGGAQSIIATTFEPHVTIDCVGMLPTVGTVICPDAHASWWSLDRAVNVQGVLISGGTSQTGVKNVVIGDGTRRVVLYDGTVGAADDEHNVPAIIWPTDGHAPVLAYARHNYESVARVRVGVAGGTIADLGRATDVLVPFPDGGSLGVTYAQLRRGVGADELLLFCRVGSTGWYMQRSMDWGQTWLTAEQAVHVFEWNTSTSGLYILTRPVGADALRVVAYMHPVGTAYHDIMYAEVNLTTGVLTSGTVTGNIYTGADLPFDPLFTEGVELAFDAPAGISSRMMDLGDGTEAEVAYATWTAASGGTDATYRVSTRTSPGTWVESADIVACGVPLTTDPATFYFPGISIPEGTPGGVFVTAREAASVWYIDKHVTADGGATFTTTALLSSRHKLSRPVAPLGGGLVWDEAYRYTAPGTYSGVAVAGDASIDVRT